MMWAEMSETAEWLAVGAAVVTAIIRNRADISAAFLADSCSLLKEGANVDVKAWVFLELCSVFLQLVFFIPFYLIWRKDCKEIGKENLAVSLKDRFIAWCLWFPFWLFPILILDS